MGWFEDEREWEMAKMDMNDILQKKYPATIPFDLANQTHFGIDRAVERSVLKFSLWTRLRTRACGWLTGLASWVGGYDVTSESYEDDECD